MKFIYLSFYVKDRKRRSTGGGLLHREFHTLHAKPERFPGTYKFYSMTITSLVSTLLFIKCFMLKQTVQMGYKSENWKQIYNRGKLKWSTSYRAPRNLVNAARPRKTSQRPRTLISVGCIPHISSTSTRGR